MQTPLPIPLPPTGDEPSMPLGPAPVAPPRRPASGQLALPLDLLPDYANAAPPPATAPRLLPGATWPVVLPPREVWKGLSPAAQTRVRRILVQALRATTAVAKEASHDACAD